jgi:AraC family transcriptional regulator
MELKLPSGKFFGTTVKTVSANQFLFVESRFAPRCRLERHSHENACLCFIIEGSFEETYGRRHRRCSKSTLLFRPSDESHLDQFELGGARCINIEITPLLLDRLTAEIRAERDSTEISDINLKSLATKLYREFLWDDEVSAMAMEGLAFEMLAGFSRLEQGRTGKAPRWLERARDLLHERYMESLSLDEIANLVDIHPVHLSRSFRRFYGSTVADYVRGLRIEFACKNLARTNLPLARIALDAGFAHQSHFSAVFRRQTGLTPAQYRSMFKTR